MIIGVEKGGTTALLRHLAQSPNVRTHQQREMFYFLSDEEFQKGWTYCLDKYFPNVTDGVVVAKNVQQVNSNVALQRLKDQCPNVKCIIMLREPAARAFSAYNYAVLRGAETSATFEEALALENKRIETMGTVWSSLFYLRNSTYAKKVKFAIELYGEKNVLVLYSEEYKSFTDLQLAQVESFIGKRVFDTRAVDVKVHNRAAEARSQRIAQLVYRILKSDNPLRRLMRSAIPHSMAAKMRHAILNLNRVESQPAPIDVETAKSIRNQLVTDREELVKLVGHCPW